MTSSLLQILSPLALLSCALPMAQAAGHAPAQGHAQAADVSAAAAAPDNGYGGPVLSPGDPGYGGTITTVAPDNSYGGPVVQPVVTCPPVSDPTGNGRAHAAGARASDVCTVPPPVVTCPDPSGAGRAHAAGARASDVCYGGPINLPGELGAPMTTVQADQVRYRLKAVQDHLRAARGDSVPLGTEHHRDWGLYITDDGDDVRHSGVPTSDDVGFNSRTNTITVGTDHRLSDAWVIGGALGLSSGHVGFSGSDSDQHSHGTNATVYASWGFAPSAYLSVAASYENTHFSVSRDNGLGAQATSSPRGNGLGFSLAGGYDFTHGAFSLSPYLRLDSVSSHVGAFDESGTADALSVNSQTMRSTTTNLGLQMQYSLPVSWGVVLPEARVEVTRANSPSQTSSGGHLLSDNTSLLVPATVDPDRNYGVWAVGLSSIGQHGLSMFADFEASFLQQGYQTRHFSLGLRTEL